MKDNIKPIIIDYPCTTDYDRFKHLVGNRGVDLQRVARIKASIQERYIKSAITINGKWEIIDGQGRVQALKELGLPVYYVVDEEATLDDCIRMNITSTPWETKDYIYSGRDRGNEHYVKLALLVDRYIVGKNRARVNGVNNLPKTSYSVPMNIIIAAASNSIDGVSSSNDKGTVAYRIRNGLFEFVADYDRAVEELDYVASLNKIAPAFGVASKLLLFVKRCADIDEVRLRNQIVKYQKNRDKFPAYNTTDECILAFEAIYNYKMRKNLDIRALYNKYREEYGKTIGKAYANGNR